MNRTRKKVGRFQGQRVVYIFFFLLSINNNLKNKKDMRQPKTDNQIKKKSHPRKSVEEYIPWGSTKVPSTRIPGQA